MDYLAWNVFDGSHSRIISLEGTPEILEQQGGLSDVVNAYLAQWHPILSNGGWPVVEKRLATMSDFQAVGAFRQTPLYREAYRFLEADFQAAESIGRFGDRILVLSYNRRLCDFTSRERAVLSLVNRRLDAIAIEIHRQELVRSKIQSLSANLRIRNLGTKDLTPGDLRGLSHILRGERIAPHVSIQLLEKLGLEGRRQLAALLYDAFSSADKNA